MIRIRSWAKWQGPAVYEIVRKRKKGSRPMPVVLGYVAVASNFDDKTGNFERFAALVGGGVLARGYLTMVLGFVAREDASSDILRCGPDQFGHLVLSDRTVSTPPRIGRKVYEALIQSGIAEEVDPSAEPQSGREPSPPDSRPDGPPSTPPSGAGRVEKSGSDSPHAPLPGGSVAPSAPERPRTPPDKPLRHRTRELFAKTITAAVQHGTASQREHAERIRLQHEAGELDDEDIEELLASTLAWVPRELANSAHPAPASPTHHSKLCTPHKRLLPCSVCDIRETAAKRRLEGTPTPSTADIDACVRSQIASLASAATSPDDAPQTRTEPPPEDAETRERIRQALQNAWVLARKRHFRPRSTTN